MQNLENRLSSTDLTKYFVMPFMHVLKLNRSNKHMSEFHSLFFLVTEVAALKEKLTQQIAKASENVTAAGEARSK